LEGTDVECKISPDKKNAEISSNRKMRLYDDREVLSLLPEPSGLAKAQSNPTACLSSDITTFLVARRVKAMKDSDQHSLRYGAEYMAVDEFQEEDGLDTLSAEAEF